MFILLVYDIDFSDQSGVKRLNKISKLCEKYGVRVQNSVFELNIDGKQLLQLKNDFIKIIDNSDSIRLYKIGKIENVKMEILGKAHNVEITNENQMIF